MIFKVVFGKKVLEQKRGVIPLHYVCVRVWENNFEIHIRAKLGHPKTPTISLDFVEYRNFF